MTQTLGRSIGPGELVKMGVCEKKGGEGDRKRERKTAKPGKKNTAP